MPNFWDSVSQNNINNRPLFNNNVQQQNPNLLQFISQNKGKTLDQMLKEYNIDATEDDIKRVLPQAKEFLRKLGLRL